MNDNKINQKNKKSNNFLTENGLLIALYSVVGILVVVAVGLTFFMPTAPKDETIVSLNDTKNVSNNMAQSYKELEAAKIGASLQSASNAQTTTDKVATIPAVTEKTTVAKATTATTVEKADDVVKVEEPMILFEDDQTLSNAQPAMTFSTTNNENIADSNDSDDSDDFVKMMWPTKGDVVTVYSPNALVFDKTLEQFKTTNSIDIASVKGEDVFAAYDGVVKMVSKSLEDGNYIVIDHGNGWVTTYSQLDDSMKVSVGDSIKQGQQIGTITDPTARSVKLGAHLDFKVTKDNETIDPLLVLAQ